MEKRFKKLLALALSCITLLGICACAPEGETDGPISDVGNGEVLAPITPDTIVHVGGAYKMDAGKTIGFLSSEIETMSEGAEVEGLTVQLTATVEPADAWNKEVDWSFAWAEDAPTEWSSKPAENYIKIEPLTDGSTTANVTLTDYYHACAITITVTTRDGGFTASCDATCVSEYYETKIKFDSPKSSISHSEGLDVYELYSGKSLSFTFEHYNKFGYIYVADDTKHFDFSCHLVFLALKGNPADEVTDFAIISARRLEDVQGFWVESFGSGSSTDFYFCGDRVGDIPSTKDYFLININALGVGRNSGTINYFKPMADGFSFLDSSTLYTFYSLDTSEFGEEGGIYMRIGSGKQIFILPRTSVSAVSLSSKYLQLK